jgi:selenide,water dikinase
MNVMEAFNLLPDPQTNGGLLIAVEEEGINYIRDVLQNNGLEDAVEPIGRFIEKTEKVILVRNN